MFIGFSLFWGVAVQEENFTPLEGWVGVGGSSAVMFPESVWLNHLPIPVGIGKKC
jgi:hypothetical protein